MQIPRAATADSLKKPAPGRQSEKALRVSCCPDYIAVALHSCCGRFDGRVRKTLLSQVLREIVQVLRDDALAGQYRSLIRAQYRGDADVLLSPALVFWHCLRKSYDMLLEIVHVGYELAR